MARVIRYIGIDFGTSTSIVSFLDYEEQVDGKLKPKGNPRAIDYSGGQDITRIPTIIKKADKLTGEESCGCDVDENIINDHPELLYSEFKMNLGSDVSQEERKKATDLMYIFMKYLADGYSRFEKVKEHDIAERRIHVSYPAKWDIQQKTLTHDAAVKAFTPSLAYSVRDIDEPTAALLYCLNSDKINNLIKEEMSTVGKASNILIIDMGAGTTDLVLFRHQPEKSTTILAKYPEPGKGSITFGGREIDQQIYEYLLKEYKKEVDDKEENEQAFLAECKKWKEQFSKALVANKKITKDRFPFKIKIAEKDGFHCGAEKLGEILKDYIPKFPELINGIIQEATKNNPENFKGAEDIDFVILTGGHSQWFFIEDMLKDIWVSGLPGSETTGSKINLPKIKKDNWRLIRTPDAQQVVSYGLCLLGVPIDLIYKSNGSVRLEITLGESSSEKIPVLDKNQRLPVPFGETKIFKCKIKREDRQIPIEILPVIGIDTKLEPIFTKIGTNFFTNIANDTKDKFNEIMFGQEPKKFRQDEIKFTIEGKFDENMILSLKGSASTEDEFGISGNTQAFSLSPTDIAQIIKESLNR